MADTTESKYGRGSCSFCRRWMTLTKAGKVRVHSHPSQPLMNCPGSKKEPKS